MLNWLDNLIVSIWVGYSKDMKTIVVGELQGKEDILANPRYTDLMRARG